MGIRARDIVRAAKRLNIQMGFNDYDVCATGVMSQMVGIKDTPGWYSEDRRKELADKFNLTVRQLNSIEVGYEGRDRSYILQGAKPDKTYLKVGQKVAELARL